MSFYCPFRVQDRGPRAQKTKFPKNEKKKQKQKHPQGFTQAISVPNFRQI